MTNQSKVLIVDDDPIGRENLEELLLAEGYALASGRNGMEALALTRSFRPDLILLDVMMPIMDGFEACRRLRAEPDSADIPVIMLTALDDRTSRLRGIRAGADDFISKPYDRLELRARVRTITRLNRYRRLLAERAKFESVVRQAADGYLVLNHKDGIIFANPQARLYLNLPEDETQLPDTTFLELIKRQYQPEPRTAWESWPQPPLGAAQRYLVRPESTTAAAFWLRVNALENLQIDADPSWIVSLRDVTTHQSAVSGMRKFHTIMSHKLRTPLQGLLMSLEMLADIAGESHDDDIAMLANIAFRSVQRLSNDVEDVLNYVDAPALAHTGSTFTLAQLQPLVNDICNSLKIDFIDLAGLQSVGDKAVALSRPAIELVMWEILENAKKFHPHHNPTVDITLSQPTPELVSIAIQDNGISLSPEQLAQVWTPYYQADKFVTGEVPGMGLGMATVASLVWEVGGHSRIRNRIDRDGVVVDLFVPLAQ